MCSFRPPIFPIIHWAHSEIPFWPLPQRDLPWHDFHSQLAQQPRSQAEWVRSLWALPAQHGPPGEPDRSGCKKLLHFILGQKKHSLGKQKHLVESTKLAPYYWQPAKSNLLGAQRLIFHQQCLGLVPLQRLTPPHCRSNQRRRQWSWRPQQQCRPVLWRRCRWSRGA